MGAGVWWCWELGHNEEKGLQMGVCSHVCMYMVGSGCMCIIAISVVRNGR